MMIIIKIIIISRIVWQAHFFQKWLIMCSQDKYSNKNLTSPTSFNLLIVVYSDHGWVSLHSGMISWYKRYKGNLKSGL